MTFGSLLIATSVGFLAVAVLFNSSDFSPVEIPLPPAPSLAGPLKPKPIGSGFQRLFEGKLIGAESIVIEKDHLYTCVVDGRCIKIDLKEHKLLRTVHLTEHTDCNGESYTLPYCGRPLGIRRFNANSFVVADAVLGLFSVDFEKEESHLIISSEEKVEGQRLNFPDDIDFVDNDTIIFSDASSKYGMAEFMVSFLEFDRTGRLVELKVSTGETKVLLDGLAFANGVQVHPDKQSVLVSESGMARIHRYYFQGPKKGRREVFADNLPGFPDNLRLSANGKTIYVALFTSRRREEPSFFDQTARRPWIRKIAGEVVRFLSDHMVHRLFTTTVPKYGIIVELDLNGQIVNSYHDAEGKVIQVISQVTDDGDKHLYLGTPMNNYIGKIPKH